MEIEYRKSVIHQTDGGEDMETEVFLPDFGDGQEQRPIGIWACGCPVDTSAEGRSTDRGDSRDLHPIAPLKRLSPVYLPNR